MHSIRINCVSSRVTRNRINYYQMRWSFACVDNTIINRPPNVCITSSFRSKKTQFYAVQSENIKRQQHSKQNPAAAIFRLKEFIWRVDPQLWWRDECAKWTREIQIPIQRARDDDEEKKKKDSTQHTWRTCSTHSQCDFTWNDYKWSRMKWLRKWIYRTVQWVHLARDKIFVRWLNA